MGYAAEGYLGVCCKRLPRSGYECRGSGSVGQGSVLSERTKVSPCLGVLGLAHFEVEGTSGPTKGPWRPITLLTVSAEEEGLLG